MNNSHEPGINLKRYLPLIAYALGEGWQVTYAPSGHLKLTKAGLPSIYTRPISLECRPALRTCTNPQCARLAGTGGQDG